MAGDSVTEPTASLPVKGGKIIGTPYAGTHAKDFNVKGGSDNWESENAVDIGVPVGTPVYAVADGTIGPQFGSLGSGGRFAGLRLHLNEPGGTSFYYAHLSSFAANIRPGVAVKAGELFGYSGSANGVPHLHFGATVGTDPLALVKGLPSAVADALGADGATSSAGTAADLGALSAAGCGGTLLAVVATVGVIAGGLMLEVLR
jgi:murein DD-endopeptidase MepM/ murein hydrolase activator NlpD